jgi:peroxiredoxin
MNKTVNHFGCAVLSLGLISAIAFAQISRIEPPQPKVGETLTVIYNPKAEGAKFTLNDEIWLAGQLAYREATEETHINKMERAGEAFKSAAKVQEKKAAPTFRVTSLSGKQYELSALRGKVVVLNFWFIGCAPCKAEIPGLNKLVKEFKDQGVVFLAFAIDPAEDLRSFLKKTEFDYEIVSEEFSSTVIDQLNIDPFPTHIIIDREGNIEARIVGGSENRHEEIRPLIARLLKVK